MTGSTPLLSIQDLRVHFPTKAGVVRAVDGVSFDVNRGETFGLVGESGCGKSTTGRALLQLLQPTAGTVHFEGEELTGLWTKRWGRPHWSPRLAELRPKMQMIFQDPYSSLNPRMTVEDIIAEPLRNFDMLQGKALRRRVQELLERVGMDPRYIRRYPHEFSGGQRQRIGIARALALDPALIVCDEPISALDVSIQAQIMNLLRELQRDLGLTYVFIAHDLAAVRHISDRIGVMYLGRMVEVGRWQTLYEAPAHPYTKALISAVPLPDPTAERARERVVLRGDVPSPINPPSGCAFHPRCPVAVSECSQTLPLTESLTPDHQAACHLHTAAG